MKKVIAMLMVLALLLALPVTALAHGHGGYRATYAYTLCQVENCNTVGNHAHGGTIYSGHYFGDSHDYHQLCGVQGCTETGSHYHNGINCLPHYNNDGHVYHGGYNGYNKGGCHY